MRTREVLAWVIAAALAVYLLLSRDLRDDGRGAPQVNRKLLEQLRTCEAARELCHSADADAGAGLP